MSRAADIALKAAGLISTRGLAKGTLEDGEGRICHDGAVNLAVTGVTALVTESGDYELAQEVLARTQLILSRRGVSCGSSGFNDLPETTAEDVILLLKENAALDDDPEALAFIEEKRNREASQIRLIFSAPLFPFTVPYPWEEKDLIPQITGKIT